MTGDAIVFNMQLWPHIMYLWISIINLWVSIMQLWIAINFQEFRLSITGLLWISMIRGLIRFGVTIMNPMSESDVCRVLIVKTSYFIHVMLANIRPQQQSVS